MINISTPIVRFTLPLVLLWLGLFLSTGKLQAQCSASTPIYQVDLTGEPSGVWTSPAVNRNGQCCEATTTENCVQFSVTLDKLSGGLQFEITSGPVPSGAMFYQVGCGTKVAVGDSLCVTGPGPHMLTLCMPGNSTNTFTIRSIAAYEPVADASVTVGCSQVLNAPIAFDPASVTWNDITGGGTYNTYLSCTTGCASTTVTPDANAPAFVDYEVCGTSQSAVCSSIPYCDVVRVYFYAPIQVSISPDPAVICPGSTGVDLSGTVSGGSGVYTYHWTDAAGDLVASTPTYRATSIGTYTLEVRNENYPNCSTRFFDEVTVTNNLTVNAGPDQQVCSQKTVQLSGTITGATGGIWSGGAGSYSPNNTDLKALYTPTAEEIAAGSVTLTLTTTGNGNCTAVSDQVVITLYPFTVAIDASKTVCKGSTATLSAVVSGGISPYTYKWSSGETTQSISGKPAGTYSVSVTDAKGCTTQSSATVTEVVGPSDLVATTKASTCGGANGEITVGSVTGGTSPYTYSKDGTTFQTSTTFGGLLASIYTITAKDANGCTVAKSVTVGNIAGPTAISATAKPASCKNNDGSISVSSVTGGTSPYSYSIDGTTFQTSTSFTGLAAATYTVTAKDSNGCTINTTATVGTNVPTDLTATTKASTCGGANGEITVGSVTGGTSPYTYSKDGTTFQTSTTFTGLLAQAYTITVKDANGCTWAEAVTLSNIPGPSDLTASLKSSTCGAANGSITVGSVTGGTSPYTYSNDGINYQSGTGFSNMLAGFYTLWVKDANGCTYSEQVELKDIPGPTDFLTTNKPSTCGYANGEITVSSVTGGTSPYTYSKDGTTFQTSSTFGGLLAGTHTLTVKDANGCTYAKSVTLKDIPGPTDLNISSVPSTCGGANGELKVVSVVEGTSPYTYSLNGGAYQTSATFSKLLAGEHQITVKDANGCLYSKKVVLTNIPGPTDLTATTKPSTCGDNNGELSVSSVVGGTAPYSYSINATTYQNTTTFSKLMAGTYTLTIKDANGCTYAEAVEVTDLAGPSDLQATTTPSSCTTDDGTITITSVTAGTSPYTYSLDGVNYQSSATFSGLAPIVHKVWVKDANSCTATFPVEVGTDGPTAAKTTLTNASCGENDGTIRVDEVTAGTSPYLYSLDASTYQESATFTGLAAGTYTLTIKDANGCTLSLVQNISNTGGPESYTLTAVDESCDLGNGSIGISNVIGGTSPYTFSIDGGKSYSTESLFTGLSEGTYQIAVKDTNGCITLKSQLLLNSPAPTAINYTTLQETCGEQNGSLTISEVRGGISPYTYSVDGIIFQESATFTGLTAGTYQLTVQDSKGCTYSEAIVVEGITGPSSMSADSKDASCSYNDGEITISEVIGGTSPYFYSLDGINYQTYTTFTGLDAGVYTVLVRDVNGCSISEKVAVSRPGATLKEVQQVSCFGAADGSISISTVGESDFTEFSIDGGTSYQKDSLFSDLGPGTYSVIVKLSPECTITFENILIEEPRQITAVVKQTAVATGAEANGTAEISDVKGGVGPYFFTVDGAAYGSITSLISLSAGEHELLITDATGCEEIIVFTIEGLSELEIPNGFTPNSDGINDSWAIKNLSLLYPGCQVAVYNRWGSPVFKSAGYSKEWDGAYNGKALPDGTYYYIIQLDAAQKPLKGTITMMR